MFRLAHVRQEAEWQEIDSSPLLEKPTWPVIDEQPINNQAQTLLDLLYDAKSVNFMSSFAEWTQWVQESKLVVPATQDQVASLLLPRILKQCPPQAVREYALIWIEYILTSLYSKEEWMEHLSEWVAWGLSLGLETVQDREEQEKVKSLDGKELVKEDITSFAKHASLEGSCSPLSPLPPLAGTFSLASSSSSSDPDSPCFASWPDDWWT
jgi:hypothetical protein